VRAKRADPVHTVVGDVGRPAGSPRRDARERWSCYLRARAKPPGISKCVSGAFSKLPFGPSLAGPSPPSLPNRPSAATRRPRDDAASSAARPARRERLDRAYHVEQVKPRRGRRRPVAPTVWPSYFSSSIVTSFAFA